MRWTRSEKGAKFAREVGSVVLGVLIALSLGAIATEIGWTVETSTARRALSIELGELIGQAQERRRFSRCVNERLDRLAAVIDDAASTGRLSPIGDIGNPPYRTWTRGVWDSAVSAQTTAHFDRETLDNYSATYEYVTQLNRANLRELDVWTTLYGIVGPGRPVEAAEVRDLRRAIAEARFLDRFISLLGVRMRQVADAFALHYDADAVRHHSSTDMSKLAICQAVSPVIPPSYGQAPLADAIARAEANPIRPDHR